MDTKNILVCVTQQKNCERLIHEAHELAKESKGELHVINVVKDDWHFLGSAKESEALEYLFNISKNIGASLAVLKSDDIAGAIAQYADDNNISCIILGKSPSENKGKFFAKELKTMLKNVVEIKIMP